MFSTTTTAASTSMPMAIASPPKLIRFADIPNARIRINVTSAARGSTNATVSAARMLPRNNPNSTITNTVASISAVETAPTAFVTNEARS